MPQGSEIYRVLVTGEHDGLENRCPAELGGRRVECVQLPVLDYKPLSVDPAVVTRLIQEPVDWIIFASSRAVRFFSECLLEKGVDFPLETQVGCIGEQTAKAAAQDGFNADFYPTEPGTEKFLEEFEELLSNNRAKPTIFLPAAEGGRPVLANRLRELGCQVISVSVYRSVPRDDLAQKISANEIGRYDLIVFTSPSSFDAFTRAFQVPPQAKVASMGQFTAAHLLAKGIREALVLPGGDLSRLGEIL